MKLAIHKAGSRELSPTRQRTTGGATDWTRKDALQNGLNCDRGKPDPFKVMLGAMATNPIVNRVVVAPADVASSIELFPVRGLKTGERIAADPNGSDHERFAWSVLRQYVDDCGSQSNLISRHFQAKGSTGSGVQIRFDVADLNRALGSVGGPSKMRYEFVQNVPSIIERGRGGWVWHPEPGIDVPVVAAREVFHKGFSYTNRAHSPMMPLVDLLAMWELCSLALGEGVQTDLLLAGIVAVSSADDKWTKQYGNWLEAIQQGRKPRLPFTLTYPPGGKPPVWLEGGGTIQDNVLKYKDALLQDIARFCWMDTQTVLEGTGSGTHWNGILRQRDNLSSFVWPTLRNHVLDDVIAWPYRPMLAGNDVGLDFDIDDWGIWGDWQLLMNQPDQAKHTVDLIKCGHLKQTALTGLGYDEAMLLKPSDPEWVDAVERQRVFGGAKTEEQGGPGSEVFGEPPDHESDSSSQPNPTQRTELVAAGLPAGWDEFGEW